MRRTATWRCCWSSRPLFGPVASTPTAWRVLAKIDPQRLTRLRAVRARARERAWLVRAEFGRTLPDVLAGGRSWSDLVIDVDATLVTRHSEKEQTAATFKGGFGCHPILGFLDSTNEALQASCAPGNAGANTAAGRLRDGADVAELTDLLKGLRPRPRSERLATRAACHRPARASAPGAQLTFSDMHGYRFQTFATNTKIGQLAALEARHRAHATFECLRAIPPAATA